MPLPSSNTQQWPPADFDAVAAKYAEHNAWYVGDPTMLRDVYQRGPKTATLDRPAQHRGGVQGALARFWWGRPLGDLTRKHDFLHVPLAADICQASADLLFSEPPALTAQDTKTQDLLSEMGDDGLWTTFAEGHELGAALGGNFMRVTWTENRDHAFLTNVDADGAYPSFTWGELTAVTFWWVLANDGQRVIRHLERHELDPAGVGVIFHGLYEGTPTALGRAIPLAEHPATEGLATVVDEESKISTQTPGLAVEYFPNQRPQRQLRKDPIGRNLGRSDLAGIEGTLDALDETYSSWMRDIRLAKGRIIAPQYMLENQGRGRGALLDLDQDVFVGVNAAPSPDGQGAGMTINQFAIRVDEHKTTCDELVQVALRSAGYSSATFGESESASMRTATEVVAEQNRSYMTRDRKIRLYAPRMGRLLEKLLAVDAAVKRSGVKVERPKVQFGDAVQADQEALARTAQSLRAAQAASTETLVKMLHPDWEQTDVDSEVERIMGENRVTVSDIPLPGNREPVDAAVADAVPPVDEAE